MKKAKLEVLLVDADEKNQPTQQILPALQRAVGLARGRKVCRAPHVRRLREIGYDATPLAETWRDSLQRYLRRVLPQWCVIYRGGHHLAVHRRNKVTGKMSPVCFARLVEAKPV